MTNNNNEIILIIGLPGSGKTTLIDKLQGKPRGEYLVYDDWGKWTNDDKDRDKFDADVRYTELIENLTSIFNGVIISCVDFCKYKFLCNAEYYLQSQFPGIEIKRIYFENDLKSSILNIKYRDIKKGGYWKEQENGDMMYHGIIFNNIPLYIIESENAEKLSKEYIIPSKYEALPILVQNIKN